MAEVLDESEHLFLWQDAECGARGQMSQASSCSRPDISQLLVLSQRPRFWPPGVIGKLLIQTPGGAESKEEK